MAEQPMAKVIDPPRLNFEQEGLVCEEHIAYSNQSERQIMDVFYPKNQTKPMPVIVWIHGGGWSSEELTEKYRPELQLGDLAKMGFFIASLEYRLAQHAKFPAQINDVKCAVRFLRANAKRFNIDPDRIGVWGESAGGHLASLLGATGNVKEFEGDGGYSEYSSAVQAVCPWYAPCDMKKELEKAKARNGNIDIYEGLFGKPIEDHMDMVWAASPMKYVGEKLPPYLIMHGTADLLVPPSQSEDFHNALLANGNESQLVWVEGQPHGFFDGQEYYDIINEFFRKNLMK